MRNWFTYSLVAALLASPVAMAAEHVVVQLNASVPTTDFYVRPAAGTDLTSVQTLNWNAARGRLDSWKGFLDIKNTAGDIQAVLASPAFLYDGTRQLALEVLVNNRVVDTRNCRIAGQDDVKAGNRYPIEIMAAGVNTRAAGSYTGTVSIIFQPAIAATLLPSGLTASGFRGDACEAAF